MTIAAAIQLIALAAPGAESALAALIALLHNGASGTDPLPADVANDAALRKAVIDQLEKDAQA